VGRRGFVPLAGGELDGAAAGGELAGESDGAAAGGALAGESLAGREFAPGVGSWITLGPGAGAAGAGAFVAGAAAEGDGGALGSAFSVSVRVSADEVPPSSNRRKAMWTPPTMIITTAAATITLRRCCVRLPGIDAPLPAFAPPGRSRGEAAAATCAARRAAAM